MTQSTFAAALLDPAAALPVGLVDPLGRPAPQRFAVYRNNVASSLTRALEAGFPVVRQLVGDEFFAAMAQEYLRAHPPRSRLMMLYGEDFPTFLQGFPPVARLGYLPDVARLEHALRLSYHAADSRPADLSGIPATQLLAARLGLAPAFRLVRSRWPIHAIWQANAAGGPKPVMRAEDVAILRPAFDPTPHLLPQGGAAFLAALVAGQPVGAAIVAAGEGFDLGATLGILIAGGAIVEVME